MLKLQSINLAIRAALCVTLFSAPVLAKDVSPWFGSTDQQPFQLDTNTMMAVKSDADPMQTGSLSQLDCLPETCAQAPKPAKEGMVSGGAPQK
jgi:hypothetical protein